MNNFVITAYAASNVGKKRFNNEDNYYINSKTVNSLNETSAKIENVNCFIGAVCDGMGGEEAGEVASQIAVTSIGNFEKQLIIEKCSDSILENLIDSANTLICNEIKKAQKRMGTTFTLIGINNNEVTLTNIGDSRIYRYSDNVLSQISHDHTEAQTMVDAGIVTKEQSISLKEKHRLTQHLGIFPYEMIIEPYTVRIAAKANDRYLLCSDGLTDMLTEHEIEAIFAENLSIENTVNKLISSALQKGGKDNVTVLICEISYNLKVETPPIAKSNDSSVKTDMSKLDTNITPDCKCNDINISNELSGKSVQIKSKNEFKLKVIAVVCAIILLISAFLSGFFLAKGKYDKSVKDKNKKSTTSSAATRESVTTEANNSKQ